MEPQNVGLTPTPEEVQEAQRILAYFAQLDEQGEVEGELDGRVVDKYEAARAASCSSGRRYAHKKTRTKPGCRHAQERCKPRSVHRRKTGRGNGAITSSQKGERHGAYGATLSSPGVRTG